MKIGFVASPFDLLHAGHVAMLEECSKHCDYLIAGLNSNPLKYGRYPVQGLYERFVQLKAVKYVDEIIPYNGESELEEIFNTVDIDIRFIGEDYRYKDFTGKSINEKNGTEIFFNRRDHAFSSSKLKERVVINQTDDIISDTK